VKKAKESLDSMTGVMSKDELFNFGKNFSYSQLNSYHDLHSQNSSQMLLFQRQGYNPEDDGLE